MAVSSNRFLHPYYLLNGTICLSYVLLRVKKLHPQDLALEDMFGVTREQQIYLCLGMMLFTRALSAPTLDAYLASAFMFARVTILALLYFMHQRLALFFLVLWLVLYAVCPQPRYRLPDTIAVLNNASFEERIARNDAKTIFVLWCHATWSARCSQLAPVLAKLANSYKHPRIKFGRLDIAKYHVISPRLNVSISAASKQLPTVICFKQGKEVARIPRVDSQGDIPKQWTRGFTAAHVAQELALNDMLKVAKEWEQAAQKRYREKKSR